MRTEFGKVKKTLAILLVVLFLVSVTAAAASARPLYKAPKSVYKYTTVAADKGGNAVSTGNGGNGGSIDDNVKIVAASVAVSKAKSSKGDADSDAKSGDVANGNTVNANKDASGGDGGSIGFVGNGDVDWDGAVASNNRNTDSNNGSSITNA